MHRDSFRCLHVILLLVAALLLTACGKSGPKPTRADVEQAMHATWEHAATTTEARTSFQLNDVNFGAAYPANAQDVVDGVPPDAMVTAALVDFTVRNHYTDSTQTVRRQREAKVYLDKFGKWAVMTGSVRGQDQTTREPPAL